MSLQDLQKKYGDFYSPRFRVEVGDKTFTEATGVLSDVQVDTTMEGADRFSFTLNYPFDHSTGSFTGLKWEEFAPGTPVKLWLGYGKQLEPPAPTAQPAADPAFLGKISSVKTDFPSSGTPTVAISGHDLLHDMTKGTEKEIWENTNVTDVVEAVAGKYFGRKTDVDKVDLKPARIEQDNKSDYQFLATEIGEKYGFDLFVRRDTFFFKTRDRKKRPASPVVTLRYGESLNSFSPEINDAGQVKTVEVRGWDSANKNDIVGIAEQEQGTGKLVFRETIQSEDQARSIARAEMDRISTAFVTGSGETIGIPEIRAGVTVSIEGVSEKFTRKYFVEQATHSIGGSGYTTSFQVTERPK